MEIQIVDNLNPEDTAMLQALYSRSSASVTEHLEKVDRTGSGKFMEQFYIGYGHSSIGQCGTSTIFLENVSLLAAKTIQNSNLYNGQECSTRYLDFNNREIIDPVNSEYSKYILNEWMGIYNTCLEATFEYLKENTVKPNDITRSVYEKSLKAKAFDIARGFLPCGITTNVSLHTTLQHAYEHFSGLKYHPLNEVNTLADQCWEKLYEKYPNSFKSTFNKEQQEYLANVINVDAYSVSNELDYNFSTSIDPELISKTFAHLLSERPKHSKLPKAIKFYGDVRIEFPIDFGSFRDIQRHRSASITMPLVHGGTFNNWYIEQLPPEIQERIIERVNNQYKDISSLYEEAHIDPQNLQYYFPLGTCVEVGMVADLRSLVYILELRSQKTVHPTLRHVIHWIADNVEETFPSLKMYIDRETDSLNFKRGSQDIIEKCNCDDCEDERSTE